MSKSNYEMSGGCFTTFMLFFLAVSIGLLFWAYSEYENTRYVIGQEILVSAEVVDINELHRAPGYQRHTGENSTAPRLAFSYEGDTVWYNSEQYSNLVDYRIGEKVKVYVNPFQPSKSIINTWSEKWGATTLLGVLGTLFLMLSVGSLVGSWLKK